MTEAGTFGPQIMRKRQRRLTLRTARARQTLVVPQSTQRNAVRVKTRS